MEVNEKKEAGSAERYRVFLTTHKGLVRSNNEDNFTINSVSKKLEFKNVSFVSEHETPVLAAVFDGMGGESKGEYASFISAKMAKGLYNALKKSPEKPMDELVTAYIQGANDAIRNFLEENKCRTGGSTVAAVVVKNGIAYPFSMGDSRIYSFSGEELSQVSKDQTLAMKKFEANIYTFEEAEQSNDSHKLTAFLGVDNYRQGISPIFYAPIALSDSDKILLCSDGLYDEVSKDEIRQIIIKNPENPTMELVRAALNHGGEDNVTCVLIERAK